MKKYNTFEPSQTYMLQDILESSLRGRMSVKELCDRAAFETRHVYYNVLKGNANPDSYIRLAIAAGMNYQEFLEFLDCSNISMNPKISLRNKLITEYIKNTKREDINICILDEILRTSGVKPFFSDTKYSDYNYSRKEKV